MTEIVFSDEEGETFYSDESDPEPTAAEAPYADVVTDAGSGSDEPSRQVVFDPVLIEGELWTEEEAPESHSPYDAVLAPAPPQSSDRAEQTRHVSAFDAPERIADRLWGSEGLPREGRSPYDDAVDSAYALNRAPGRIPRVAIQAGRLSAAARAPAAATSVLGPVGAGAAGLSAYLAVLGGLAYVAVRQGDTFEERVRRRVFGQRLVDEGIIDAEELEEFVRSGNLPEHAARRAAIYVLGERGDIDLWEVTTRGVTATGQPRDNRKFWRLYVEQKGNLGLSQENLERIRQGRSPRVDPTWVKTYPEHHGFEGRRLDHHHVEGTSIATPLPDLLHHWLYSALHLYVK